MNGTSNTQDPENLRQKAERLLQKKSLKPGQLLSETEMVNLIHELEVHQIELEILNDELSRAKHLADSMAEKYGELYDFSPSGYFSLSPDGIITELNLTGAQMLDNNRSSIKDTRFDRFISLDTKPLFYLFLANAFKNKTKETCEVTLAINNNLPVCVHLTGIVKGTGEYCLMAMTDITSRKRDEEENKKINFELHERLKEINCHSRISEVTNNSLLSFDEACDQIVQLIPGGWQFPDITGACIQFQDKVYQTDRFKSGIHFLHQDVKSGGQVTGFIEVSMPGDKLPDSAQIFLPEESDLLISISERLGNFIDKKATEDKLVESEKKYRNIFNTMQDVYYEASTDGIVLEISNSVEIISKGQYCRDEMIGKSLVGMYADPDARNSFFLDLFKHGQVNDYELSLLNKDGSIVPVSVSSRLIFDADGQPLKVSGTIRDITERKAHEEALSESEMQYRTLANSGHALIWTATTDKKCDYFNQVWLDFTGRRLEQELGYGWTEGVHPDDYDRCFSIYTTSFDQKQSFSMEYRLGHHDGTYRWLQDDGRPRYDSHGKFVGYIGHCLDISARKTTEIKLRESEEKFRTITEQTGDFIGIADLNGIITHASPASASIFLISPEDMTGRGFIEFVAETDLAKAAQAFRQCFEGASLENNVEFRLKRNDGSGFFGELKASQFNTETEQGMLVIIRDITERKRTEKEIHELTISLELKVKERTKQLQEVNERLETDIEERKRTERELRWNQSLLQMMATSSPLGFLVVDNRTDEILYFNHRFCQIWKIQHIEDQMRRGELKNNDIIPHCLPVLADIPAFAESCKPLQYEGNRVVLEDEIPFIENRTIRRFTTQIRGIDDEYYGRFYIFEDITARKRTEEALRESEKRFSLFMDYLPAVVFLKDHEGRTLFINKYMDRAFGASAWMGKTMSEVFPGELGERLMTDDLNSMKLGYQKIEESLTQLDGKLYNYETRKFIIGKMGNDPLLGGISLDITERKNAENEIIKSRDAANLANLAKSEFLSRMSHELRTPMNSILGFAQLLDMGELNPKQKKGVSHILNSGKHLLGLIDEVLDISRIESGRLSLLPEPVQLIVIITETLDTIRPLADARLVKLEVANSPDSQLFVMADRKRLKQVLINLLNNAVKYNRQGGAILVKTESIPQDSAGNVFVRVSVTDTGFGIHPDDVPKLFVPFERIGSEKTQTEGTGLGLAVVKKIMDAMGGIVGVESIAGEGSTFWIDLPATDSRMSWNTQRENNVKMTAELVIANNEIAFQNEEKAKRAAELVILKKEYSINTGTFIPEKTGTLLYIEDNIQNAELVEEIIRNFRPEMRLITSIYGSSAVNLAKEILPDLIMLDLDLPDIDGIEVLARLHAEDITKSIPVVIVSADATQHQIDKLMTAGAKDYLTKPLEVNLFLKVVDEWVKRKMNNEFVNK